MWPYFVCHDETLLVVLIAQSAQLQPLESDLQGGSKLNHRECYTPTWVELILVLFCCLIACHPPQIACTSLSKMAGTVSQKKAVCPD